MIHFHNVQRRINQNHASTLRIYEVLNSIFSLQSLIHHQNMASRVHLLVVH